MSNGFDTAIFCSASEAAWRDFLTYGDWKPDPSGAQKFRKFIENGGNADSAIDAIQDGDYHDLLDQNGGPEGF